MVFSFLRLNNLKFWGITAYYRCALWSWGVSFSLEGEFAKDRPLLVVSNHCSYLDIPVLGSVAPVHFTPKSEIASWPIIGYLCRLADCIFINRNPRKTSQNMKALKEALAKKWIISLFPEGTTNDGTVLQPFRSSYFSLAEEGVTVQPVSIAYHNTDGSPLEGKALRQRVWIDDDELAPHFMKFLSLNGTKATVICHEAIAPGPNRKILAQQCHQVIEQQLHGSNKKRGAP